MNPLLALFLLGLRILGAIVCSKKAKELNRDTGGWGFFGFISPIVAMIWINCLKPIMVWEENVSIKNQQDNKVDEL